MTGNFVKSLFGLKTTDVFYNQVECILGFPPKNIELYKKALSHRSIKEQAEDNNERLEFLGDTVLSTIIGHYLFRKYPYKDEGFLTEMRSKMVNRQMLNEVAIKMGIKKIIMFNKTDYTLKQSQIFGNALEALVGAVYLDKGYKTTQKWVEQYIIMPHLFIDELELVDINIKNKLFGWATKNGRILEFETIDEQFERGRRLFTIAAKIDGEIVSEAKAFNKKDASNRAAVLALETLGI